MKKKLLSVLPEIDVLILPSGDYLVLKTLQMEKRLKNGFMMVEN